VQKNEKIQVIFCYKFIQKKVPWTQKQPLAHLSGHFGSTSRSKSLQVLPHSLWHEKYSSFMSEHTFGGKSQVH
jgi:exonuclease I